MNESARSSRSRVRIASNRRRSTTAWSVIVATVVALLTATAIGAAAGSTDALIVTGNGSLDAGEQVLQSRLVAAGYTVTVRDDSAGDADQDDYGLIVISRDAAGNQVGDKYADADGGVILLDPEVWDDHGLSTSSNYSTSRRRAIQVLSNHPIIDGLAQVGQDIRYASSNTSLGWVRTIAPSGTPVAAQPNGSRIAIAAFDTGDLNSAGTALPGRRTMVGIHTDAFTQLRPDGQTLLDQIIAWTGESARSTSAPTGLTVTSALTDRATVNWDGQPDATSWQVTANGQTTTVTSPTLTVTGLAPNTSYPVSIAADGPAGPSTPATVNATTADRLAAPTITGVSTTEDSITVTWSHADDDTNRDSYNLSLNSSYFDYTPPNETSFTYTNLNPDTTYVINVLSTSDTPELWSPADHRYSDPAQAQATATTNSSGPAAPVINSITHSDGANITVAFNQSGSGSFDVTTTWSDDDPNTADVSSTQTVTAGDRTVTLTDTNNIVSESTGTVTVTACQAGTTSCAEDSQGNVYYARPWGVAVDGSPDDTSVPIKFGYTNVSDPTTFSFHVRTGGGQWQLVDTASLTKQGDNRYHHTVAGLAPDTNYEIGVAAVNNQANPLVTSDHNNATMTATTTGDGGNAGIGTSAACQNTAEQYCVEWPHGFVDMNAAGGPAVFTVNGINLRDGVNSGWHYDVAKLAQAGAPAFNTLRIALNWQDFQPQANSLDDPGNLPPAWAQLDALIGDAANNGFKVILDPIHVRKQGVTKYNDLPGSMWNLTKWAWDDYYDQPGDPDTPPAGLSSYSSIHSLNEWNYHVDEVLDGYALPYLMAMVNRYGDNANVIAIDLVNEPRNYGTGTGTQAENQVLIDMQLDWINNTLRTLDPHTPLIVEPMAGNINPTCIDMSGFGANVMMSLHDYDNGGVESGETTDGYRSDCASVGEKSDLYSYSGSLTRADRQASQKRMIDSWLDETGAAGVPLFIGEYGYNKNIPNMTDAIEDKYNLYESLNSAGVPLPRTYWVAQYDGTKELYEGSSWLQINGVVVGTYATGGQVR